MNDSSPRRGRSQLSLPKLLFFTEVEKWHCFELKGKPLRRVSHAGTEWRANNVNSVYPPSKDLMWKYCQQLPAVSFIWILRYCFVHHLLLSVSPPSRRHAVYFPGHWLVIGAVWQEVTASVVVVLCLLWCGEACSLVIYIKALGGNGRPGTWSSLMAQSVLGDDQCGEMIRRGRGPTLEQKRLLRNNYYCMKGL